MHVRARALALPCPALVNEFDFIHLFSICGDALNETQRHVSSRRTSLAHVVAFSWQVQCEGTPANESPPCGEQHKPYIGTVSVYTHPYIKRK